MSPKLSIVVPAYNEAARLGKSLQTILSYLNQTREPSELIVVDDGSEDETASVAEESLADAGSVATRVIHYEKNRGKGYAARVGRSEEHTSELQSPLNISYAVFCLK